MSLQCEWGLMRCCISKGHQRTLGRQSVDLNVIFMSSFPVLNEHIYLLRQVGYRTQCDSFMTNGDFSKKMRSFEKNAFFYYLP